MPDGPRWRLDRSYRRTTDQAAILGGAPLRLFRLTPAGRTVADALERGTAISPNHGPLTARMVAAGALHPVTARRAPAAGEVTIVIPAYGAAPQVPAIDGVDVIVVDDASPTPLRADGATVVRRAANGGPGAARNTGLAHVATPLVAFVDSDVTLDGAGWLAGLLGHFDDPAVALVAPRIAPEPGTSVLARYEATRTPLDLGPDPADVHIGGRVAYVPSATVVCRVDALRSVGGFDESLRYGEDVDLVWRLVAAGHRCRYEPAATVRHAVRGSLAQAAIQRFRYGTSAGPLSRRHPGALTPVRVNRWSALVWAAVLARRPIVAVAVAAATIAAARRRLRLGWSDAAAVVTSGHVGAGAQLGTAVRRVWWPIVALAATRSGSARRAALLAAAPPVWWWWRSGRTLDPVRWIGLAIADDAVYGAGVWRGAWRARCLGPLVPRYRSAR